MSSLNQAFIKAYGKDAASEPSVQMPGPVREAPRYEASATPTAPSPSRVLETWYSADSWYRAESAPLAPVPAPHVAFTTGYPQPSKMAASTLPVARHQRTHGDYEAPAASDLAALEVRRPARTHRSAAEEADYRLSPPEPIALPEIVIEEEPVVRQPVKARAAVAPVVMPPVEYYTTPPVDAVCSAVGPGSGSNEFGLYAPMQVVTGWEATVASTADAAAPVVVVTNDPPPVALEKMEMEKVSPAPLERPVTPRSEEMAEAIAEKVVAPKSPPAVQKPVTASAAPVAQMRLDAAVMQPVPKPHAPSVPVTPPVEAVVAPARGKGLGNPSHSAETKVEAAPTLQPAWEVDRFQWPEHCRQLLKPDNRYLADVGQRLANAAKEGLGILAITSTRRGEGRTTLALCMARAAADAGVKVALVDADSDNPQLVNELGVEAAAGWHDVVTGKQPLAEAAILSIEDKFTLFPWTTAGAIKSLNDPKVTRVLKQIAATHELVILDLGPTPGRETRMFEDGDNCPIDAAVLVRDVRWTSAIEASRVASHLVSAGVESVGIAENFS